MTEDQNPKASEESVAAGSVGRQRKKRKWDEPAETLVSAGVSVPGALPFGMGGVIGIPVPGVIPLSSGLITNTVTANSATASLLLQSPSIPQNTAAIVQKLNQPKIQDELIIAREIVINDAEPTVRYKLTKRQTQEEIQKSTGAVVITRGKYRPPNGLPDNEKPLYLHISAGAHLKDTAERIKAVDLAASMVEEILKQGQNSLSAVSLFPSAISNGQVAQPLSISLYLGFDPDPLQNIAARIRGPNDQYINHIMNETGASVVLRGRGSGNFDIAHAEEAQQPLHLYLSSTNPKSLESARNLAENLLDTICAECGLSRISSCKVYNAVPPPQQLAGVQSSGEMLGVNSNTIASLQCTSAGSTTSAPSFAANGAPISAGSNICPPGAVLQAAGALPNYAKPQQNMVSYSHPSVNGGTCYSGYGGIYPQATPLQQVALALRKAPVLTNSVLASTSSHGSTSPNMCSSSNAETEKRPLQRRKFQELPVSSKGPTMLHKNLRQGSEFLKPGSKDSGVRVFSSIPPPKKLAQPGLDVMPPPPPPKTMSPPPPLPMIMPSPPPPPKTMPPPVPPKTMPPAPPKFSSPKSPPQAESQKPAMENPSAEPVSDTLLKLVEYEEDDDDIDGSGEELPTCNSMLNKSSKPFWAV